MKNLLYLVLIICLPTIAIFQFLNWRKFNPPSDYTQEVSQSIDPNYHDENLLLSYFENLQNASTYARHCWKEHRIDVKSDKPHSPNQGEYIQTYQQYISNAEMAKLRLEQSAKWKSEGFSNEDIIMMEKEGNGLPPNLQQLRYTKVFAQEGDKNELVFQVQKALLEQGYEMPIDGWFKTETSDALITYQQEKGLFPSGKIDKQTIDSLFP